LDHAALAGLRVFLVEDEMVVSLLIEDVLADEQCIVVGPFARVADALEAARTEVADVAVLDVNVAGVKVYPVADVLVERGIPHLFLSGYGPSAIQDERPHACVCSKPFRPEQLVALLVDLVSGR
jgi:DNA-binding NtrC family response regulator